MREVMDAVSDPAVTTVVAITGAQSGKTEALNNVIGAVIDLDPCPILVVNPTLEMAAAISKDRLQPMFKATPCLRDKVAGADDKSRDGSSTMYRKSFKGGQLTLAGANSPASLASRPVRIVLCDEVDRFPASAGAEGDPVNLARKRTLTFWNRKVILTSTPTILGASRITMEFEQSDKRHYFLTCPDCQHEQTLKWENVHWPEGKPKEAVYHCEECGSVWDDATRWGLIRKGRWIATAPFTGTAGFHLNQIYSSFATLDAMVIDYLAAKGNPELMRVFWNTALGLAYDTTGDGVEPGSLLARREDWGPYAPDNVMVVTCGVDTQNDRLEVERVGFGLGEESWSLDHRVFYGDPSTQELWDQLDEYLRTPTVTADGRELPVSATCIDSGGSHTHTVYAFCTPRMRRRVMAVKGGSGGTRAAKPIWPKSLTRLKRGHLVAVLGVDTAKDVIYSRLRIEQPGPGFCHFNFDRDQKYFDQLTAEKCVTETDSRGFTNRVWTKAASARNEALDIRVYAYAALCSLNVDWKRELRLREKAERVDLQVIEVEGLDEEEIQQPVHVPVPAPAEVKRSPRKRQISRSSFMGR